MSATSFDFHFDLKEQLELLSELNPISRVELLSEVPHKTEKFPIYGITITKSTDPSIPTLALVGGVHGLETIGTSVILSYLRSLNHYLSWDKSLHEFLKTVRLVFLPHLNPVGAHLGQRSNGNGVDLMRNSPIESEEKASPLMIYRGHRISPLLPWYRGVINQPMEIESQTLIHFIEREVFCSQLAICVDVHSGFGAIDRLWFPYARKKGFFPDIAKVTSLKNLLDQTLPNHIYQMEPQSVSYTVHGDLWDYLYEMHREKYPERTFLPLTLEMGSWNWLKKNPFQIFTRHGIFHPIKRHRTSRVLRRHAPLFDFLAKATASPEAWFPQDTNSVEKLKLSAVKLWGKC